MQTGDLTDRGSEVRAVLDRLRSLEQQAPAAGGRVESLLGNHEISNLIHLFDELSTPAAVYREIWGDFASADSERRQRAAYRQWRDWYRIYPGCVQQENLAWREDRNAWLDSHPLGFVEYTEALSPAGEYGRWLRGRGVATEVDGTIFLHGGISPQLVEQGYRSVADLNGAVSRAIEQYDQDRQRLIDEEIILPFSSLWEMHCALFVEMARLEKNGKPKAMGRHAQLAELDARLPGKPGWFPTDELGPLWYRGLATVEEDELAPQLDEILAAFGARRIAVGHTPQPGSIVSRLDGRVYLMDTAMAYPELGGRAAALEIDGDLVTAIYANKRVVLAGGPRSEPAVATAAPPPMAAGIAGHGAPRLEPGAGYHAAAGAGGASGPSGGGLDDTDRQSEAGPQATATAPEPASAAPAKQAAAPRERVWIDPDGKPLPFKSIAEVRDFLSHAKVVDTSGLDTGVTLPRKLLLEQDGVRAHAIFHNVEIEKRREKLRGGKVVNFFRDHYANNVAAFELSQMLGMTNVPPVVIRRVGRDKGSLQLWIENSRTEADRRELDMIPTGEWRLAAKDMQVFDNLVNNIDRNQGNILYDADWNLWLIDHTRTLGRNKELPTASRVRRCSRSLWEALRALDQAEVKERLEPYVGIYEVQGLMARRDLLVALLEEQIAARGEMAVLFDYSDPEEPAGEGAGDALVPEELTVPAAPTEDS